MHLHALSQEIDGHLIGRFLGSGEDAPRSPNQRFLAFDELTNHVFRPGHACFLSHGGKLGELGIASWSRMPQRPNSLRNKVDRKRQFVVLLLEHKVERLEHGARDVPMEVVGLEI